MSQMMSITAIVCAIQSACAVEPNELHWQLSPRHVVAKRLVASVGELPLDIAGHLSWTGSDEHSLLYLGSEPVSLTQNTERVQAALPTHAMTVEATVWLEESSDWGAMVGYLQDNGNFEKGWMLGYQGRQFCFAVSSVGANEIDVDHNGRMTYLTSPNRYELRKWYHVMGRYDGKHMQLYVNGELQAASDDQHGEILYPDQAVFSVGAYRDADESYPLRGMLESVAVQASAMNEEMRLERVEQVRRRIEQLPQEPPVQVTPLLGPLVRMVTRDQAEISWLERTGGESFRVEFEERHAVVESVEGDQGDGAGDIDAAQWKKVFVSRLEPPGEYRFAMVPEKAAGKIGDLYEFDSRNAYLRPELPDLPSPYGDEKDVGRVAEQLLQLGGWRAGYCLMLGARGEQVAYELVKRSKLQVVIVEPDEQTAQQVRQRLAAAGVYGSHVTVHVGPYDKLPYVDYCMNLVVVAGIWDDDPELVSVEELRRVMRPAGGAAFYEPAHLTSSPELRPELEGAGAWTHQYGQADNTSCSRDELVTGDVQVQWWGAPGPRPMPDRGGRNPSPLSVAGFLYTQGDRVIYGQDAYNGTIYWTLMAPDMRRSNIPRDCGNAAAAADQLYLALSGHCLLIEPRSGQLRETIACPGSAESNETCDWGFLGYVDETLIGSAVAADAAYIADNGEWYEDYAANQVSKVVSAELFAMNRHSGDVEWRYERGRIVNSTITMDQESVYFLEARNAAVTSSVSPRQSTEALKADQYLVALDRQTGKVRWEQPVDLSVCDYMTYVTVAGGKLIISGTDQAKTFHHFAFDATTGSSVWDRHDSTSKTHHSGHLDHMVVIGDKMYSNQHVMDLATGRDVGEFYAERRGCGIMSGSNNMLMFRDHFHSMWDLKSGKRWEFPGIRSGCWLGIVSANGLILAPESSSGCSCTHAIQTSVVFRPLPAN
jgi:outer membrane protein assembly factor BamB